MSNKVEVNTDGIVSQKRKLSTYIFEELGYPKSESIRVEGNTFITEGFMIEGYKIKYNIGGLVLDFSEDKIDYHTENIIMSTKLIELYNKLKDKFDIKPSIISIVDSTKATRITPFRFKEEECEIYKAVEHLEITKDKDTIYKVDDVKVLEDKKEKHKNSCAIKKEKSVDCEIESVYNDKHKQQQIPNIKKENKTMITILRDLKEKLVNVVEETRAVKAVREKIEKIKDRAIYSTWDIKWFASKHGVELVVNEDGHLDVYLCAKETYSTRIRYYLVGNYQNEFKCGEATMPNGERREYKRLGTMLNALAAAYEEYEFYFPNIDRKLTSKITKECEKQYNLNRGIGKNDLLDETLNELYNAEDDKLVDALISTLAKGDIEYEDNERVHEVYASKNTALGVALIAKVKLALEIQLVRFLKKKEVDNRMMEIYSRLQIDEVELDDETLDKFDILRFAINGKNSFTIEDFQIETVWGNTLVNENKIYLFEQYNIKVDIIDEELIMFDVTEQLEGQINLCEYENNNDTQEDIIEKVEVMTKEKMNKKEIGVTVEKLADYVASTMNTMSDVEDMKKREIAIEKMIMHIVPSAKDITIDEDLCSIVFMIDAEYTGAKPTKKQMKEIDAHFSDFRNEDAKYLEASVTIDENKVHASIDLAMPYYDEWYNNEWASVPIKQSKDYIIDTKYQNALVYKDDIYQKYRRGSISPIVAINSLKHKLSETGNIRCKKLYEDNIAFYEDAIAKKKQDIANQINEVLEEYQVKGYESSNMCLKRLRDIKRDCPSYIDLGLIIRTTENMIIQKQEEYELSVENNSHEENQESVENLKKNIKNLEERVKLYKEKELAYENKIEEMKKQYDKLEKRLQKAERIVADITNIGNTYLDVGRVEK